MYLTINKINDSNCVIKYDTFKNADDANTRIEELKALGLTDAFAVDVSTISDTFALSHIHLLQVNVSEKTVTWQKDKYDAEVLNRKLKNIRSERNKKLAESDWTQSRDITLDNDDAWKSYRNKLRDFPSTVDINNIVWPTKPS